MVGPFKPVCSFDMVGPFYIVWPFDPVGYLM